MKKKLDYNEVYKRPLDEKYTEEELNMLIRACDEEYEANCTAIDNFYNSNSVICEKKDKYERMLNEIKYKDFKLETKSCYHIINKTYGYHGVKERVIKINSIENDRVKATDYVLRDDDGDETFFIQKRDNDKYDLIDTLIKCNAEIMTNSAAQFWVNRYILIEQIGD